MKTYIYLKTREINAHFRNYMERGCIRVEYEIIKIYDIIKIVIR